jgi:diguanylate cyclase (GGDEF)-like protein/PAS domain S-box-containing protein
MSPATRISAAIASLTISALFAALAVGLVPDPRSSVLDGRKSLCETMAIHCAAAAKSNDLAAYGAEMRSVVGRNKDLLSAGIRSVGGELVMATEDHAAGWGDVTDRPPTPTHMHVPITREGKPWGTVELRFRPTGPAGLSAPIGDPALRLIAFVAAAVFVTCLFYSKMILRNVDIKNDKNIITRRIRDTLDTLAEGVVILDNDQRITLANETFAKIVGRPASELRGRRASELPWLGPDAGGPPADYPWARAMREGDTQMGVVMGLRAEGARPCTLSVNSTPIYGNDGTSRGALATFDDLTTVETKNASLRKLLQRLRQSRRQVRQQNKELESLATTDPMTSCLNRRSFFARFEAHWATAARDGHALSCVMVDVDHFKSINDRHGHGVGDQVLQMVSEVLKSKARKDDLVCRYGGEEFCILLPGIAIAEATEAAERYRRELASVARSGVSVTASLGVSAMGLGAREPHEMLDQADKALYAAKHNGRDRVVRWDEMPDDPEAGQEGDRRAAPSRRDDSTRETQDPSRIPFHAVAALISALAYRDMATAEHSRRVARLCLATARGLLSQSQCHSLETAALLHDIGKLGIPDAILLKPGSLTEPEWAVMRAHDRIGEEIIMASISPESEVTAIIRNHHCWYGGSPHDPGMPTGAAIPLGARILTIADAFDAMTSDRVYRRKMTRAMAIQELRLCSGKQFDPGLVERFIAALMAGSESRDLPSLSVPRQVALEIGLQIEKLAIALDLRDVPALAGIAGLLKATAREHDILQVLEIAVQIEESAASESDWAELNQLTGELLNLCRSTYSSYLPSPVHGMVSESELDPSSECTPARPGFDLRDCPLHDPVEDHESEALLSGRLCA